MECDAREYISWEEGGWLGKPETAISGLTDKEISLSLGFTWPSLKVCMLISLSIRRHFCSSDLCKTCIRNQIITFAGSLSKMPTIVVGHLVLMAPH